MVVDDAVPAGYALSSATPSAGTYVPGTGRWTVGPLAVGALNDYVFGPVHGAAGIRYSMLVVGMFGCIASLCFWRASAHLPRELAR